VRWSTLPPQCQYTSQLSTLSAGHPGIASGNHLLTPSVSAHEYGLATVAICAIWLKGRLDPAWAKQFEPMTITNCRPGLVLTGDIVDQAALHGTLNKIRNLNLPLISR
jgi:hypothetical protein